MSSGSDLRIARCLDLMTRLRQTVTEFADREEQLTRDLENRRYRLQRKFRDAIAGIDARRESLVAAAAEAASEEEARVKAIHEARRTRIEKLRAQAIRGLPKRAKDEKERWMGELQMRHFFAERKQTTGNENAKREHAQFSTQLATERERVMALERRAAAAFGGYPSLVRTLRDTFNEALRAQPAAGDRDALFTALQGHVARASESLARFEAQTLPKLFRYVPLGLTLPLLAVGAAGSAWAMGLTAMAWTTAAILFLVMAGGLLAAHAAGKRSASQTTADIVAALADAGRDHNGCAAAAEVQHAAELQRIQDEHDATAAEIKTQWDRAGVIESEFETLARRKIDAQVPRLHQTNADLTRPRVESAHAASAAARLQAQTEAEQHRAQITEAHNVEAAAFAAEESSRWSALASEWTSTVTPLHQAIASVHATAETFFPPWSESLVEHWQPPVDFLPAARFGTLDLDLSAGGKLPKTRHLALPCSPRISLPLTLLFPQQGSLLIESEGAATLAAAQTLNNVVLRLLANTPPGRVAFTIIDPSGLGKNFAGLMNLADYEEALINRRIWTQSDQIEERLEELSEHIEKVIQMYLRSEFATITEYNEQAGSVAEKYHFLVIADLPAGFTETAARKLQSIVTSGARCGVFTLIHRDIRQPLPEGIAANDLRAQSVCLRHESDGTFSLEGSDNVAGARLSLDQPPAPEHEAVFVHRVGKASVDSNRVEVPFSHVAPSVPWSGDTTNELRVAIGRTGATKLQYLAIGKGTRQHALFAGKTGSGKSTLFHVIITNLALTCSPDQVEFYLIDFKKGVEFKCYADHHLPHARVIAIESDREFGLSVLQRVDEELKRRGDLFRKLGVQDIAGYKREGGGEPIPRTLLIIDEFQEFFVEDDTVAQTASLLFDRIVRQGRAFGIHVLLGTQTLGGAYSLARATLGQMVIRVALQCNEADAYLIMDENNSAPRLLSRPGEGIYNDSAGAIEGNSPFQVVWLSDRDRDDALEKAHALAVERKLVLPTPIVFEGNAPAAIRENDALRDVLASLPAHTPSRARCWLGAPNSIKGPTGAVFQRQSGNHLLIVSQRDDITLSMLALSVIALAAQFPAGTAKFVFLHTSAPGTAESEAIEALARAVPHPFVDARPSDLAGAMSDVAAILKDRVSGTDSKGGAQSIFLFIHGMHRMKKLRNEDEFSFSSSSDESSPGSQLAEVITEGSALGIHIVTTVDTFNNVSRYLNRKALSEFEMRVAFQMSANDSASLIDSPMASNLGMHRAIFHNEQQGTDETFRPYAPPPADWLAETLARLAARKS